MVHAQMTTPDDRNLATYNDPAVVGHCADSYACRKEPTP